MLYDIYLSDGGSQATLHNTAAAVSVLSAAVIHLTSGYLPIVHSFLHSG